MTEETGPRRRSLGLRAASVGVLVVWFGLTLLIAQARTPPTEALATGADQVIVVGVPGLTLDDVSDGSMPHLAALAGNGAVAAANIRSGGSTPMITEAYATLGAGYRVRSGTEGSRAVDRPPDETPPAVRVADMPSRSQGPGRLDAGQPGALAEALARAGRSTAVVTNADIEVDGTRRPAAPAAVAAADPEGAVAAGTVGGSLTVADPSVPGGVASSRTAFADEISRALVDADLVVVDPGVTTRLSRVEALENKTATPEQRRTAMATTDGFIGDVVTRSGAGTALMVVGITPPTSTWQFAPIVVAGSGVPAGHLDSPSTHRRGLVTITDIAPTILDLLDAPVPASMTGHALAVHPGVNGVARLRAFDDMLVSRRATDQPLTLIFILAQSALYAVGVIALMRGRLSGKGGRALLFAVLTCAAWPLATFWIRASLPLSSLGMWTGLATWVIAAIVAAGAMRFRSHPLDPLLVVCGALVATIVADLSTGAHLQYGSFFGYSPNKGTRFTGIGNASFALLGAATVVVCTALVLRARRRADGWWAAVLVATAVVAADGAPWMGADVGGILALVPVLLLLLWALRGTPVSWRNVAVAVAVALGVLSVVIGLDALRPAANRTHISRFFLDLSDWEVVRSTLGLKISANVRILRESVWAWLVPITVALSLLALVVGGLWQRALPPGSPQRHGLVATLALALVGWMVNDSGIVVVALASVFIGPYVLLLARAREVDPRGARGVDEHPALSEDA